MATKQTFYTVQEFCNNANWAVATQKNYKYALLHYSRFLFPHKKDPESALSALSDHVRKKTDPAKDIKPIKPPLTAPVTFRELLPWIGLGVLILALAFLIYYYLKKRKQKVPVVTSRLKTSIPPYEAAMEALESLRMKKLWQSGRVKEYYSEMTDIVREYIELRFPVRALEMTTSEINAALRQTDVNGNAREKLHQTLILADLVKFAKEQPLPLENDLSLTQCVDFVRETRPRKEPEPIQPEKVENVEQNIVK